MYSVGGCESERPKWNRYKPAYFGDLDCPVVMLVLVLNKLINRSCRASSLRALNTRTFTPCGSSINFDVICKRELGSFILRLSFQFNLLVDF